MKFGLCARLWWLKLHLSEGKYVTFYQRNLQYFKSRYYLTLWDHSSVVQEYLIIKTEWWKSIVLQQLVKIYTDMEVAKYYSMVDVAQFDGCRKYFCLFHAYKLSLPQTSGRYVTLCRSCHIPQDRDNKTKKIFYREITYETNNFSSMFFSRQNFFF